MSDLNREESIKQRFHETFVAVERAHDRTEKIQYNDFEITLADADELLRLVRLANCAAQGLQRLVAKAPIPKTGD